jgi:hypothetical protein
LRQSIESRNLRHISNQYVTLSFYARAGANFSGTTLATSIITGTGSNGNLVTGFTGQATAASNNTALTTQFKRYTLTTSAVLANTITQLGVQFQFTPSGTAGAADYVDITNVQLEIGQFPSLYESLDTVKELTRCQRYAQLISNYTNPQAYLGGGQCTSGTAATFVLNNVIPMAADPSLYAKSNTGVALVAGDFQVTNSTGTGVTCNAVPSISVGSSNGAIISTSVAAGLTAGNSCRLITNSFVTTGVFGLIAPLT